MNVESEFTDRFAKPVPSEAEGLAMTQNNKSPHLLLIPSAPILYQDRLSGFGYGHRLLWEKYRFFSPGRLNLHAQIIPPVRINGYERGKQFLHDFYLPVKSSFYKEARKAGIRKGNSNTKIDIH
jgi:hypothetical protein